MLEQSLQAPQSGLTSVSSWSQGSGDSQGLRILCAQLSPCSCWSPCSHSPHLSIHTKHLASPVLALTRDVISALGVTLLAQCIRSLCKGVMQHEWSTPQSGTSFHIELAIKSPGQLPGTARSNAGGQGQEKVVKTRDPVCVTGCWLPGQLPFLTL